LCSTEYKYILLYFSSITQRVVLLKKNWNVLGSTEGWMSKGVENVTNLQKRAHTRLWI
jgi:hypothetical protein